MSDTKSELSDATNDQNGMMLKKITEIVNASDLEEKSKHAAIMAVLNPELVAAIPEGREAEVGGRGGGATVSFVDDEYSYVLQDISDNPSCSVYDRTFDLEARVSDVLAYKIQFKGACLISIVKRIDSETTMNYSYNEHGTLSTIVIVVGGVTFHTLNRAEKRIEFGDLNRVGPSIVQAIVSQWVSDVPWSRSITYPERLTHIFGESFNRLVCSKVDALSRMPKPGSPTVGVWDNVNKLVTLVDDNQTVKYYYGRCGSIYVLEGGNRTTIRLTSRNITSYDQDVGDACNVRTLILQNVGTYNVESYTFSDEVSGQVAKFDAVKQTIDYKKSIVVGSPIDKLITLYTTGAVTPLHLSDMMSLSNYNALVLWFNHLRI
jgi:hypothetical protein